VADQRSAISSQRSEEEAISRQPSAVSGAEKKQSAVSYQLSGSL